MLKTMTVLVAIFVQSSFGADLVLTTDLAVDKNPSLRSTTIVEEGKWTPVYEGNVNLELNATRQEDGFIFIQGRIQKNDRNQPQWTSEPVITTDLNSSAEIAVNNESNGIQYHFSVTPTLAR